MKVRRLNQNRAQNKSKQRWLQQELKFATLQQVHITIITSNPWSH